VGRLCYNPTAIWPLSILGKIMLISHIIPVFNTLWARKPILLNTHANVDKDTLTITTITHNITVPQILGSTPNIHEYINLKFTSGFQC